MVEQIIRQRDLYKDMLARHNHALRMNAHPFRTNSQTKLQIGLSEACGLPSLTHRAKAAGGGGGSGADGSGGVGVVSALFATAGGATGSGPVADGPDYKAAYDDAVAELEKVQANAKSI
eukprot:scaffold198683_cov46-Prasinocladus_malaysianus.AAC.1